MTNPNWHFSGDYISAINNNNNNNNHDNVYGAVIVLRALREFSESVLKSFVLGCAASCNFFNALEIDQGYLVYPLTGTGIPPRKKINREILKFGLKISV